MRLLNWATLIVLFSLLISACAGYDIRPATLPPSEQQPSDSSTAVLTIPTPVPTSTIAPTITGTPTGAWIDLTPGSGNPGDTVQIDGFSPNPPSDADLKNSSYQTYTNVCWGGCQVGLMEEGQEMTWSTTQPGHFSLPFIVPSAPWLAEDGLHPLDAGDYPVSIQYLDMDPNHCSNPNPKGCFVEIQAGSLFHLEQGSSRGTCQVQSCGELILAPSQGAPGTTIQVRGWAPLLSIIGNNGFGYELALIPSGGDLSAQQNVLQYGPMINQGLDGSLTASFQVPQFDSDGTALNPGTYFLTLLAENLTTPMGTQTTTPTAPTPTFSVKPETKGWSPLLLAPTQLEITPAPAWTQLSRTAPLWIQPSASLMNPVISMDPLNPNRLAYCSAGEIQVSPDAGKSWSSIPTGPVATLVDSSGYSLDQQSVPTCFSATLDATHPESFYAVFPASNKQYGAPPIYYLAYFTTDGGKTWQPAPTPPGSGDTPMMERFGGFWSDGKVIQALYSGDSPDPNQPPPVLIEQTADGGVSWSLGTLTCPTSGPCVRWEPAPGSISGMGADLLQFVTSSQDNGQTWVSTGQSVQLRMDGPHSLAALSQTAALLISGEAAYPLLYTTDAGKSWQSLSLPLLPNASRFDGLQLLPDGSLISQDQNTGTWYALSPSAQDWCKLNISIPENITVAFQVSGNRVWWISPTTQEPESASLVSFSCQ